MSCHHKRWGFLIASLITIMIPLISFPFNDGIVNNSNISIIIEDSFTPSEGTMVELTPPISEPRGIEYVNGYYYLFGLENVVRSTDLETWENVTGVDTSGNFRGSVCYYNDTYVIGFGGTLYYSFDGLTFTSAYSDNANDRDYCDIVFFDGYFYAFRYSYYDGGQIVRSKDGISWSVVTISGYTLHQGFLSDSVVVFKGTMYAVEYVGYVIKSTDGITWSQIYQTSGEDQPIRHLYNYSDFIIGVGETYFHWSDTNGENWQGSQILTEANRQLKELDILNDNSIYIGGGRATGTSYLYASLYSFNFTTMDLVRIHDMPVDDFSYSLASNGTEIAITTLYNRYLYKFTKTLAVDTTAPAIDSPADIQYELGVTGNAITWSPSDANPSNYEIYRNGLMVDSGSWSGGSITINIDGLSVGTYNYTILVRDGSGNYVTDEVMVTVYKQSSTTSSTTTSTTTDTSTSTMSTTDNQFPPLIQYLIDNPMVLAAIISSIATLLGACIRRSKK